MSVYTNILIVRTDRIGDVVLTTPSIKALRDTYPDARITVLVAPLTRELVDGNMCLDEVLVDDRGGEHKGLSGFLKLVRSLRRRRFDCALVLHTKKRTNLTCFLAGIPVRVGYKNNKFGFLLNRPVTDVRHKGEKHEAQYCLDVIKALGVDVDGRDLAVDLPVKEEALRWVDQFRRAHHITDTDRLVAVHPGASDPAKRWPEEHFAEVIDVLAAQHKAKAVIIGAADQRSVAQKVISFSRSGAVDLTGATTVGQLAALLMGCGLLVSNDSGPVHVAAGVGTPVVSIFTRNQPGINPERWRPLGENTRVVSVSPEQSDGISFKKAGAVGRDYMELIPAKAVLEAVDALFKLC